MNHQLVFPWRGEMVALLEISALVAVERRLKEVSPVSSVIVISTKLPFTYLSLTLQIFSAFVSFGLVTCESSRGRL